MGETEGKKEEADYKRLQTFPLVRHSDMPEEMRVETMELCVTACEKFSNNNESAAKMIKETMDKKFGSSWHVVIGEGFGLEITHELPGCEPFVPASTPVLALGSPGRRVWTSLSLCEAPGPGVHSLRGLFAGNPGLPATAHQGPHVICTSYLCWVFYILF
ncbi:dynein light chain 4, axonemal isoform X1 [Enhydra lutris kenyoni]|uniref:Dynein light chain n=1 Tax=Enhydra lutris kenyoni TaxID=391180 RepID=A0A2Y9L0B6_ENHLU|nr:dynein light chain 4, axonemal isoform X1 [Enhydra lutris kenyoni]